MNSKVIVGIVVAAIVIIGGGIALYMANSSDTTQQNETKRSETSEATTKTSLSALLEKGDPQKCTFNGDTKDGTYTGTAYFSSDKQMRNDYTSTTNDKTYDGGMIISDETQYFWSNDTKKGYKMAITASDTSGSYSESQASSSENVDTNAKFSFQCESWTVDESMFTPPSDVTIQDLTQVMQGVPAGQ